MRKEKQLKSCCKNSLSSREVVARDLPHLMPLLLLNRKQQPYFMREAEDPGLQIAGMTPLFNNSNNGFTLIELLVVVLIIGILAAVALPQYQKTVWKTRGTQLLVAVQALHTAQKAYYLANGTLATTFDELSIEMPFKDDCSAKTSWLSYNPSATDCKRNEWGFIIITGTGHSHALFNSTSPKYRWSGFIIPETETSQYQNELLCTDIANGKKDFCTLMGWNTKISCNNNGVCTYRK